MVGSKVFSFFRWILFFHREAQSSWVPCVEALSPGFGIKTPLLPPILKKTCIFIKKITGQQIWHGTCDI